jgi:hypothetical protein
LSNPPISGIGANTVSLAIFSEGGVDVAESTGLAEGADGGDEERDRDDCEDAGAGVESDEGENERPDSETLFAPRARDSDSPLRFPDGNVVAAGDTDDIEPGSEPDPRLACEKSTFLQATLLPLAALLFPTITLCPTTPATVAPIASDEPAVENLRCA